MWVRLRERQEPEPRLEPVQVRRKTNPQVQEPAPVFAHRP